MELMNQNNDCINGFLLDNEILNSQTAGEIIDTNLVSKGAVLIRNLNLSSPEKLAAIIAKLSPPDPWFTYEQRATPRKSLGANIFTSTEYNAISSIYAHNECANQTSWPRKLYFFCKNASEQGGATPLTDMRAVTSNLPDEISSAFKQKGLLYMRSIGAQFGVSLEYAFGTTDKFEIEDYCSRENIEIVWKEGGALQMRFVRPAFREHPISAEILWFNHLMFYSVVSLEPKLRRIVSKMPINQRAFHAAYADGSEIPVEMLEEIRRIYDKYTYRFDWHNGDLLIIDNMLFAHGRDPYKGNRDIWVALTEAIA